MRRFVGAHESERARENERERAARARARTESEQSSQKYRNSYTREYITREYKRGEEILYERVIESIKDSIGESSMLRESTRKEKRFYARE